MFFGPLVPPNLRNPINATGVCVCMRVRVYACACSSEAFSIQGQASCCFHQGERSNTQTRRLTVLAFSWCIYERHTHEEHAPSTSSLSASCFCDSTCYPASPSSPLSLHLLHSFTPPASLALCFPSSLIRAPSNPGELTANYHSVTPSHALPSLFFYPFLALREFDFLHQ